MSIFDSDELWSKAELPAEMHSAECSTNCNDLSEIVPGLYLTSESTVRNQSTLMQRGVVLIINLCGSADDAHFELVTDRGPASESIGSIEAFAKRLSDYTCNLSSGCRSLFLCTFGAEDEATYDIGLHFMECSYLIELFLTSRARSINSQKNGHLPCAVVHCLMGISRSVSVVTAYLMKKYLISKTTALMYVKSIRPVAQPNPGFHKCLSLWEKCRYCRSYDSWSAQRFAVEIGSNIEKDSLSHYTKLLFCNSSCVEDRKNYGLAMSIVFPDFNESFLQMIVSVFCQCIKDEEFVDVPFFFKNVCEIVRSVRNHCIPKLNSAFRDDSIYCLLLCATIESHTDLDTSCEAMWSFFSSICQDLSRSSCVPAEKERCSSIPFPFVPFFVPFSIDQNLVDREETLQEAVRATVSSIAEKFGSRCSSNDVEVFFFSYMSNRDTNNHCFTDFIKVYQLSSSEQYVCEKLCSAVVGLRLLVELCASYKFPLLNGEERNAITENVLPIAVANQILAEIESYFSRETNCSKKKLLHAIISSLRTAGLSLSIAA